jgi:hypothetical protein
VGSTVALLVFLLMVPASLTDKAYKPRMAFAAAAEPAGAAPVPVQNPEQWIKVTVSGLPSEDAAAVIATKITALLDPGGRPITGVTWTGRTAIYNASPVADPKAFAKRIGFGTITKVDDREISVEAGPIDKEELALQAARRTERKTAFAPTPEINIPADADPVTRSLLLLKSPGAFARKDAAARLITMPPDDDRREEVQAALKPMLGDPDGFVVNEVIKAMAAWKTSETVPTLIPLTADSRFSVRWQALETLGFLGDPRAAPAIAARLKDDGMKSGPALRAIGEAAEPAVLALLRSPDPQVRHKACEVLAQIGGAETLRTMRKMRPDPDFSVRVEAQNTMKSIAARVGSP